MIFAARLGVAMLVLAGVGSTGAAAQDFAVTFGEGGSLTGRSIQMIALITILSIVPGLAVMPSSSAW